MSWNYSIDEAPRGKTVNKPTKNKTKEGQEVVRQVLEKDLVILATKCGKVTISYWIPDEKRWCHLAKDEQPEAWQLWPNHPRAA